jgi:hypothetical protein
VGAAGGTTHPGTIHEIELLATADEPIERSFAKPYAALQAVFLRGPAGLRQVMSVDIESRHVRTATCKLETIKSSIAPYVEYTPARQVRGNVGLDLPPLHHWEIAQWMLGGRLRTVRQMQVVKPRREGRDLPRSVRLRRLRGHTAATHSLERRDDCTPTSSRK